MVGDKNIREIIALIAVLSLFVFVSYFAQNYQDSIESLIGRNSLIAMFAFVFLFILSVVFTPISTIPLIPLGAQLWGVFITTILSVVGWTLGAVIAFSLARKFGMPLVSRFLSLKKVEKVEKLIPRENVFWTIFFFRAVMPFDGLSYILGLFTKIEFRIFFWATLLGLIPFCFVISYLGSLPTLFLVIGLFLASLFCILGIIRLKRRHDSEK